ncbi:MAG: hypothetical protein COV99_01610 [Bacteroidetes bacterium CG12_big_fil_rev_8_21_14_0_65_60_17]|nr:MAG: hypothetical protein COV99_01610 [Bacteroidetes bacterium CG12_big_fil_rev_8_21_14_0_65_60_17]
MALPTTDIRWPLPFTARLPGGARAALVAALLVGLAPRAATAQTFITREGTATFTSSVPLHEFTGTSGALSGMISLETDTVDFFLDLATLDTGKKKRDKDMRRTLEVDEFPFAEFTGTLTTPVDLLQSEPQPATVRGQFTLHGVTRDVVVHGTLTPRGEALELSAAWTLNLEDYRIEPPRLLVIKVDPEQDIEIRALLHTQDP